MIIYNVSIGYSMINCELTSLWKMGNLYTHKHMCMCRRLLRLSIQERAVFISALLTQYTVVLSSCRVLVLEVSWILQRSKAMSFHHIQNISVCRFIAIFVVKGIFCVYSRTFTVSLGQRIVSWVCSVGRIWTGERKAC